MLKTIIDDANRDERLALCELNPILDRLCAIQLRLIVFLKDADIQIHSEEVINKLYALQEGLDRAITIQKLK